MIRLLFLSLTVLAFSRFVVSLPTTVPLEPGTSREGIALATDGSTTLFAGRLSTGGVDKVDFSTGSSSILVPDEPGFAAVGLWTRGNRLFIAGGASGPNPSSLRVYNVRSGKQLASCPLNASNAFINDVVALGRLSYWTDSMRGVIYKLDNTALAECRISEFALPAAFRAEVGVFKANGIENFQGGLLVAHLADGAVYDIRRPGQDDREFRQIVSDGDAEAVDGLIVDDSSRLYTVQNSIDQIGVWKLSRTGRVVSAEKIGILLSSAFSFPTTGFVFNDLIYVVNARFDEVAPGTAVPSDKFDVVAVNRFLQ